MEDSLRKPARLRHIEFLSAYGILLVVLGHSGIGIEWSPGFRTLRYFIYQFHMPLFMFVSGYLSQLHYSEKLSWRTFLARRSKRLLIPYLGLNMVAFLIKLGLERFALRPVQFSLKSVATSLVYPHESPIIFFWFLPTLWMVGVLLFPAQKHMSRCNRWGIAIFTLSLLALSWIRPLEDVALLNIGGVVAYLFYYWVGGLVCAFDGTQRDANNGLAAACLGLLVLTTAFRSRIPAANPILPLVGILMSYHLSLNFKHRDCVLLCKMYGCGFQIYLLSWFPQVAMRILTRQVLSLPLLLTYVCIFLAGLLGPYVLLRGIVLLPEPFHVIAGLDGKRRVAPEPACSA